MTRTPGVRVKIEAWLPMLTDSLDCSILAKQVIADLRRHMEAQGFEITVVETKATTKRST